MADWYGVDKSTLDFEKIRDLFVDELMWTQNYSGDLAGSEWSVNVDDVANAISYLPLVDPKRIKEAANWLGNICGRFGTDP